MGEQIKPALVQDRAEADEAIEPAGVRGPGRGNGTRQEHESAFVLHSYPFKETSVVVELLTRSHGRAADPAATSPP